MGFVQGEWEKRGETVNLSYYYFGLLGYAEARIENNRITVIEEGGNVLAEKWVKEKVVKIAGAVSLTVGARHTIEVLDHYLIEPGKANRLYIDYQNITPESIRVRIQILWLDENGLIIIGKAQENIRGPISPGQGEVLVYRPEFAEGAADYHLQIHATEWDRSWLPYVAFPEVEPEEEHSK